MPGIFIHRNLLLERELTASDATPQWLKWARELHVIGQTGLFYTQIEFDRQRFQRLIELSAEMMQSASSLPLGDLSLALSSQKGYITPKVDVRGAVFDGESVLLVQEVTDGLWSLPGGWADVNEPPSAMIIRELLEETGLHVEPTRIVGVYEANHGRDPIEVFHSYKILFNCKVLSGELTPSYETPQVKYFPMDDLPELSSNRTQSRFITEAYQHWQHPELITVFD